MLQIPRSCRGQADGWLQVARDANIFEANDRRRAVALLCKLAKSSQVFPQCYELTGVEDSGDLIGSGGFADVYKGKYRGQTVCLKVFRVCHEPRDSDRLAKVSLFPCYYEFPSK